MWVEIGGLACHHWVWGGAWWWSFQWVLSIVFFFPRGLILGWVFSTGLILGDYSGF